MPPTVRIRDRRADDVPTLVDVLAAQQPASRYPFRWPLPFPPEKFIVRATEEGAWVAESGGRAVGHVALTTVEDCDMGRTWSAGAQRPIAELVCVSVLFVDPALRGYGVGGLLLDTAVAAAGAAGRTPVLDVVQGHSAAVGFYRHRGWAEVGHARPEWLPADEPPVLLMVCPDVEELVAGPGSPAALGQPRDRHLRHVDARFHTGLC